MLSRPVRLGLLLNVVITAPFLAAQSPPPANLTQGPVFRTGARDVVVDIVATDKEGHAIPGLHASDFEVFEDGKPQKVDFFEEHLPKTLPPGAEQPLPAMPPGVFTNVPPAPESDSVNILLLDTLNTPRQDFSYARNQVIKFLHKVAPGTRIAIVVLSDKLTFVQGFTSDTSALLAVMNTKQKGVNPQTSQTLVSRTEEAENNETLAMRSQSMGPMASLGVAALESAFESYQDFAHRNRTLMTLEALNDLARYLANVPGRKNLIWFSTSFPVYIFPNLGERAESQDLVVPLSDVRKAADALTAARVAVYPVNAEGMMNDSAMNADSPGLANGPNIGPAGSMSPMGGFMADAARRADTMTEMNQLAADTGGKAIFNNNDLSTATARDIADGSEYYTLTYAPTNSKLDGSYRNIEIKARDNKVKLAYRRGYNADPLSAAAKSPEPNPLHPLMFLGLPDSTEILYGLRVHPAAAQPALGAKLAGANTKLTGPFTRYSVEFMIRWTDVRLDPGPQTTHTGKVQVELLAYSPDGTALNWIGGTMSLDLKPDIYAAIQRSGIPAHFDIDVPQGKPFVLSTGVYDWLSGKAGTLQVAQPPVEAAQNAVLPAATR
ncbi:MAG TPA: VWA domain-containing protein [Terracidiphilus sp.]|nr:VWA domain-containing protein [Terracidiphilus sp.]